jgi:hypothetical protein
MGNDVMKKTLLLLTVAALAWSCDKDDNNGPVVTYDVLTFENAPIVAGPTAAGENLYSDANPYYAYGPAIEGYDEAFSNYTGYTDSETGLSMAVGIDTGYTGATEKPEFWSGGIAPSTHNDMETSGQANQCSVYYNAPNGNGGHNGSKTFGLVFGSWNGPVLMSFAEGVERTVEEMWVANSTYTALYQANLGESAQEMSVEVCAFDKEGNPVVDAQEEVVKEVVSLTGVTQWKRVSLSKFGKVNSIGFTVVSADSYAPAYFCIDDVKVVAE